MKIDLEWAKKHLRGFDHSLGVVERIRASEKEYKRSTYLKKAESGISKR